jgi:hypothetical protein
MARFVGVVSFVSTLVSVGSAWADNNGHHVHSSVPELSTTGAAAGIALIVGAAAIAFGRRRRGRKP